MLDDVLSQFEVLPHIDAQPCVAPLCLLDFASPEDTRLIIPCFVAGIYEDVLVYKNGTACSKVAWDDHSYTEGDTVPLQTLHTIKILGTPTQALPKFEPLGIEAAQLQFCGIPRMQSVKRNQRAPVGLGFLEYEHEHDDLTRYVEPVQAISIVNNKLVFARAVEPYTNIPQGIFESVPLTHIAEYRSLQ